MNRSVEIKEKPMRKTVKRERLVAALLVGALFGCGSFGSLALAGEAYPSKPVRLVVPFPPGGGTDLLSRTIGEGLSKMWGERIVVDNRPGAGTKIGTEIVARASPDGYTMLMASFGHGVNVNLYKNLPFDPLKSFEMITLVATAPNLLVAHPSLPVKTTKDLIALAKAKPGQINFGSFGSGTSAHLAGELFNMMAGVKLVHVPYKGSGPALRAVVGNEVQVLFSTILSSLPFVKSGRLRAVAVTSSKRLATLPDMPTVAETLPGFETGSWYGIMVPAGTPKAVVTKINQSVVELLHRPDIKAQFVARGAEIYGSTPVELRTFLVQQLERWAKVIKVARIKAN